MRRLLLVRHGETTWNSERRLQGRRDIELSDLGRRQVQGLREHVERFAPDHVVVSPLRRAVGSCEALGVTGHAVDDRWQEADLGRWEGRLSAQVRAEDPHGYASWRAGRLTPPDGESFEQLSERVRGAVDDLREVDGTVLVVTHGGPVRAACRLLVGLDPVHVVPAAPGSLTVVDLRDGRQQLRGYNLTGTAQTQDPPD